MRSSPVDVPSVKRDIPAAIIEGRAGTCSVASGVTASLLAGYDITCLYRVSVSLRRSFGFAERLGLEANGSSTPGLPFLGTETMWREGRLMPEMGTSIMGPCMGFVGW